MQSNQRKTILIIEDVPAMRDLFSRYLKRDDYAVDGAESGEAALNLAGEKKFDGILLDINMPGIDGIETCRRLRTLDGYQFTPILIVTSADNNATLSEAFEAGCDDFIIKPINQVVLRARLKAHIQRADLYHRHERMQGILNRYVSPKTQVMIEQCVATGEPLQPEKREACVLFTDLRGFSQLAQQIEPEELFNLLSEHLAHQAELVYQHGGYVEKYAGDGITAVFEGEGMEQRSCLCAQNIIAYAQEWIIKKQNHLFAVSCGIDKGDAVFGDIGSPEHLKYTMIGASVNLAAKLCDCAGPISIIVAENIYSEVKQDPRFLFLPREDIRMQKFNKPVMIYELTPFLHNQGANP